MQRELLHTEERVRSEIIKQSGEDSVTMHAYYNGKLNKMEATYEEKLVEQRAMLAKDAAASEARLTLKYEVSDNIFQLRSAFVI